MPPANRRPPRPARSNGLQAIKRYRSAIERALRGAVPSGGAPYDLVQYHLGWRDRGGRKAKAPSGKLLRPALCLLCCEAVGGEWRRALPAAASLELLHNFTLIHDDVEDASAERHGRATVWRLWGPAQAINAGDGLFALAHATLLRVSEEGHPPRRVLRATRMLDDATLRLCEGQHIDLARRNGARREYLAMVEGKTAALLAACCGIGAVLGGASERTVERLHEFGRGLGLAFQIRDDVLGIWGDERETGKPASDDLRAGKRSYPVVTGLERASPAERRELLALLSKSHRTEKQVEQMRGLLDRLGARRDAERAARRHARAAIESLRGLRLKPKCKADLERLALFAAERRS